MIGIGWKKKDSKGDKHHKLTSGGSQTSLDVPRKKGKKRKKRKASASPEGGAFAKARSALQRFIFFFLKKIDPTLLFSVVSLEKTNHLCFFNILKNENHTKKTQEKSQQQLNYFLSVEN